MNLLLSWIISTIAVLAVAYILPGVSVSGFFVAFVVAVILGLINAILRPLAIILTLPLTIFTFGLFIFVINALLVLLTSVIVPGFTVQGFWWALLFSLLLSLVTGFLKSSVRDREQI